MTVINAHIQRNIFQYSNEFFVCSSIWTFVRITRKQIFQFELVNIELFSAKTARKHWNHLLSVGLVERDTSIAKLPRKLQLF